MKFRLRQMEVFRAVMLTGSINGAARLLFTSQPSVSRVVAHTEQTLGLALFNRVKGKLVPTPEGEALYREVDEFYKQALRVDEFARGLAQGPTGTLKVSSSPCLSHGMMARAITLFVQRWPSIRVDYHTTLLNSMAQEVLSNGVDLAISVLPIAHANLTVVPFAEGRMVCVVPVGHALADRERVTIADLADHPLVAHHPTIPFGQLVSAAFRKADVAFGARIDVYQTDVACSLVRAGAGVAMVDEFTVEGVAWSDLVVLPLADEIRLTPSIVRSVFDTRTTHADKFEDVLRETWMASTRECLQAIPRSAFGMTLLVESSLDSRARVRSDRTRRTMPETHAMGTIQIFKRRREVDAALVAKFRGLPVANVSDNMQRLTAGGPNLRPMHSGAAMAGPAFTVKTRPGDNLFVHKAIALAAPGDVIVVDAGGDLTNAIIGELMSGQAARRGLAGLVINGSIRDADVLRANPFPVFAAGVTHRGPYKDGPGQINVAIALDGMVIEPGDLIIGDGDGVLCVPFDQAESVLAATLAKHADEEKTMVHIAAGTLDTAWVDAALKRLGVDSED